MDIQIKVAFLCWQHILRPILLWYIWVHSNCTQLKLSLCAFLICILAGCILVVCSVIRHVTGHAFCSLKSPQAPWSYFCVHRQSQWLRFMCILEISCLSSKRTSNSVTSLNCGESIQCRGSRRCTSKGWSQNLVKSGNSLIKTDPGYQTPLCYDQ